MLRNRKIILVEITEKKTLFYMMQHGNESILKNKKNEENFTRFLKQSNSGLKLLRGTKDLNKWSTQEADENNNMISTDC